MNFDFVECFAMVGSFVVWIPLPYHTEGEGAATLTLLNHTFWDIPQDFGSIGELLAAVATIVTLIYLARQLRANTAAVQGDSRRAHRAASNATNLLIASDPAVATLFNSGLRDFDALTPEQHTQFAFLMAELIGTWEIAHQEFESGVVDESPLQRAASSHAVFLRTPGGRKWWDRYRSSYPPGFQQYVGTQIDNQTD